MLKAWYYANSLQWGRHFKEVAPYVNAYLDWEPGTPIPPGKKLYVCCNIGWQGRTAEEAAKDVIKAFRGMWGRVEAIEIADEPDMTQAELTAAAVTLDKAFAKAGLLPKPIGATFTGTQILKGNEWRSIGLDFVGLEAYIQYIPGEPKTGAVKRMRATIAQLVKRVGKRKVCLVAQSYDRNKMWKNVESMVAIQRPVFEAAKALGDQLVMLTMFAYARPGGARDYPTLRAELNKLCKEF